MKWALDPTSNYQVLIKWYRNNICRRMVVHLINQIMNV